jgi:hypothetical protein
MRNFKYYVNRTSNRRNPLKVKTEGREGEKKENGKRKEGRKYKKII